LNGICTAVIAVRPLAVLAVFSANKERKAMKVSGRIKRLAAAAGAVAVLSGTVIAAGAGAASASTIPKGYVQLCAQGNYVAYVKFPSRELQSFTVKPGHCWKEYMGGRSSESIKVYGIWNTHPGQSFYIGTKKYDGAVSGIGIGAEGITTKPHLYTW
jgi:hypothetical protein